MKTNIIAFTGLQLSGKTTCTDIMTELLEKCGYKPKLVKFAQPIYDIVNSMCDRLHITFDKARLRPVMQFIGTYFREQYGPDFWVERWELDVKHARMFDPTYPKIVVLTDDVRFDNEAKKIRAMGGTIIRVVANDEVRRTRGAIVNAEHESEKGIDDSYVTATVYNNSNLTELKQNIAYLLELL